MLAFDGDCNVLIANIGVEDPILDALGAPHATLRPDGLLLRDSACKQRPCTLRVTHGGGMYLCNGDRVLQSYDLRTLAHIVPLVLATGAATTRLPMVRDGFNNSTTGAQLYSPPDDEGRHDGFDFASQPRMEEELVRTALVLVWYYSSNTAAQHPVLEPHSSQRALLSNRSFGSSLSLSTTQRPRSGSSSASNVQQQLARQQEQLEEPLAIESKERAVLITQRCLIVEFPTRRVALKLFEAVHQIILEKTIVLIPPPEPKQTHRAQPDGSGLALAQPRRLRHDTTPTRGVTNGGSFSSSDGGGGALSTDGQSNSGDGGSDSDDDWEGKRRAVTEASTHLRELFEQTDDALDDQLGARRRHGGSGDAPTTIDVLEEDTLQKDSTALAQSIIEKLTAMKISIKSPFPLINAFVENSPAQLFERRLHTRRSPPPRSALLNMGGDADEYGHHLMAPLDHDGVPTDADTQDTDAMAAFQRLEQSKGPLPVLEALRSRRPEYISKSGALEFFNMCNVLYKKDRELLSQRGATNAMHRRVGFAYLKYFTGPAVKRLFESWVLQRRRESYQLQQYVMDLLQYFWYLKRCNDADVKLLEEEQAAERAAGMGGVVRSADHDAAAMSEAASAPTDVGGAIAASATHCSSDVAAGMDDAGGSGESSNPLYLYAAAAAAASGSVEELLDLCRRVHVDIATLFAARHQRYAAAGVSDPLAHEAYHGKRSRSNVFPDPVMDQLELQTKKKSSSAPS